MQFYDPHKKNSTITTQVMCAIVFWLFSLAWLFWFQNDEHNMFALHNYEDGGYNGVLQFNEYTKK